MQPSLSGGIENPRQYSEQNRLTDVGNGGAAIVKQQDVARCQITQQSLRDDFRVALAGIEAAPRPRCQPQIELLQDGLQQDIAQARRCAKKAGRLPVSSVSVRCAVSISRLSAPMPVTENVCTCFCE